MSKRRQIFVSQKRATFDRASPTVGALRSGELKWIRDQTLG